MKAPDAFRTISEVGEALDLPQHVLRFWETRFTQIKPMKRGGGRRYYRPEDVDLLRGIRLLLYGEGFTIRGVQRLLKEKGVGFVAAVGQTGSVETVSPDSDVVPRLSSERKEPQLDAPDLNEDENDEVTGLLPPEPAPVRERVVHALTPESRRRMESALSDLAEAKRLLDAVR